ncbi:MAG: RdgB/HAM1 family non-canonical purine NTP pyrophosphatase [bacterium]
MTLRAVLATGNPHKAQEIRDLLGDVPIELRTLGELGLTLQVEEDGSTYRANAMKKADAAARKAGLPAIADDSGIEVDALDGAPGIRSSRFAGEGGDDPLNNALLLERLDGVLPPDRTARFVCVAVWMPPPEGEGEPAVFRGEWEGRIAERPSGSEGFGYDPLFLVPEEGRTVAELGEEYKREHSHRARAFRALAAHLRALALGA